ncbi:hypothetical protein ACLOJK_022978 [Asimina triloba]
MRCSDWDLDLPDADGAGRHDLLDFPLGFMAAAAMVDRWRDGFRPIWIWMGQMGMPSDLDLTVRWEDGMQMAIVGHVRHGGSIAGAGRMQMGGGWPVRRRCRWAGLGKMMEHHTGAPCSSGVLQTVYLQCNLGLE